MQNKHKKALVEVLKSLKKTIKSDNFPKLKKTAALEKTSEIKYIDLKEVEGLAKNVR